MSTPPQSPDRIIAGIDPGLNGAVGLVMQMEGGEFVILAAEPFSQWSGPREAGSNTALLLAGRNFFQNAYDQIHMESWAIPFSNGAFSNMRKTIDHWYELFWALRHGLESNLNFFRNGRPTVPLCDHEIQTISPIGWQSRLWREYLKCDDPKALKELRSKEKTQACLLKIFQTSTQRALLKDRTKKREPKGLHDGICDAVGVAISAALADPTWSSIEPETR